jgi:hypothetical protein
LSHPTLFREYRIIARRKTKLPLDRERELISRVKQGDASARKLLLGHLFGFFLFRIHTTLYPWVVRQYGEDIFQECVLLAAKKIGTYRPDYRDRAGQLHPVHLSSYMWKSVTGLMFAYVKSQTVRRGRDAERVAAADEEE